MAELNSDNLQDFSTSKSLHPKYVSRSKNNTSL